MRTLTIGETTIDIDRPLERTEGEYGVSYRLNANDTLTCEKLVVYGGDEYLPDPEWSIVHDPKDAVNDDFYVIHPSEQRVHDIIGADEARDAWLHVRATKRNPEA